MPKKKLDRRTLRWCAKRIRKWAKHAERFSVPRTSWDSTTIASRAECAVRAAVLRGLADEIEEGRRG